MKISYIRYPHRVIEIVSKYAAVGLWVDRIYIHRHTSRRDVLIGVKICRGWLPVKIMWEVW